MSEGTFGIFPRKLENAVFILWVRLRSFLFAVFLFFMVRTAGFALYPILLIGKNNSSEDLFSGSKVIERE